MNPRKRGDPLPAGGPEVGWRNLHRRRDRGSPSGAPEGARATEPPRGAPERAAVHSWRSDGAPRGLRRVGVPRAAPEPREGAPSLQWSSPEPPRGSVAPAPSGAPRGGSLGHAVGVDPPNPQGNPSTSAPPARSPSQGLLPVRLPVE